MSNVNPNDYKMCPNHPDKRAMCLTARKGYSEWLCHDCNKAKMEEWKNG